jgi:soluble lytic murein transglycosylase-like protein
MNFPVILFLALIGAFPPPQIGRLQMPQQYWLWILEAAEANRISPYVIAGVMAIESRYDPLATSGRGRCIGLMQLHQDTARKEGVNPWDPRENISGGARVLARLLRKHRGNLHFAVADYNGTDNLAYQREVLRAIRQAELSVNRFLSKGLLGKPLPRRAGSLAGAQYQKVRP